MSAKLEVTREMRNEHFSIGFHIFVHLFLFVSLLYKDGILKN